MSTNRHIVGVVVPANSGDCPVTYAIPDDGQRSPSRATLLAALELARRDRDELLAALKRMADVWNSGMDEVDEFEAAKAAYALIARIEGGR